MKKELFKTLSEKIIDEPELRMVYPILAVKDVKEFIKIILEGVDKKWDREETIEQIKKRAGEKLINKILCMHAFDLLDVIEDNSVDLIYIDPPFGEYKTDKKIGINFSKNKYLEFMEKILRKCYKILNETGSIYLHCDYKSEHLLRLILEKIGFIFQNNIAWCYRGGGHNKKRYARKYDNILFYTKSNDYTFNLLGKNIQYDYWLEINTQLSKCGFLGKKGENFILTPYQKPIALLKKIISISSNENDLVLDCFCGSGTTAVSCKQLNRNFICCDSNKEYVDIANKRLNQEVLF